MADIFNGNEIYKALAEYSKDVPKRVEAAVNEEADKLFIRVKGDASAAGLPPEYAAGFRKKKLNKKGLGNLYFGVVQSKVGGKDYRKIVHLLEMGHEIVCRKAGRIVKTGRRAKVYSHIIKNQAIAYENIRRKLAEITDDKK